MNFKKDDNYLCLNKVLVVVFKKLNNLCFQIFENRLDFIAFTTTVDHRHFLHCVQYYLSFCADLYKVHSLVIPFELLACCGANKSSVIVIALTLSSALHPIEIYNEARTITT